MKRGFLWAGVFLAGFMALVSHAAAAENEISIAIDRPSVILGDGAIFTITAPYGGPGEAPEIPPIDGIDVRFRGVRRSSFHSVTVVVNGQKVQESQNQGELNFDYEFKPKRAGVIEIPAFTIRYDGKDFKTEPFRLEVLDAAVQSEDIFIRVEVPRTRMYLGEKIPVTVKWYFNKSIQSFQMDVPWLDRLENAVVADPELDPNGQYQRLVVNGDKPVIVTKSREFYKGQPYAVVSFTKILTPLSTGSLTLEPIFFKCEQVTGYQRRNTSSFFDDFFESDIDHFFGLGRRAVTEPFSTRSEPLQLQVEAVPEDSRPGDFRGAIGNFGFEVELKPSQLRVGEPLTLSTYLFGEGNLESAELAAIDLGDAFKAYEAESRILNASESPRRRVEKIVERVYVAKKEGLYTIPEVSFSFLDPGTGEYRTLRKGPFTIQVEPGSMLPESSDKPTQTVAVKEPTAAARSRMPASEDIRYIKSKSDSWRRMESRSGGHSGWRVLIYLLPLFAAAGIWKALNHRRRLREDRGFSRGHAAFKKFTAQIKTLKTSGSQTGLKEAYASLHRSFVEYLADKLNAQPAALMDDPVSALAKRLQSGEILSEVRTLHDRCHRALYSSDIGDPAEFNSWVDAAGKVVKKIERQTL